MAHHMPSALLLDRTLGTHFVLLERSDDVAEDIVFCVASHCFCSEFVQLM
jgi:hypothetical protein